MWQNYESTQSLQLELLETHKWSKHTSNINTTFLAPADFRQNRECETTLQEHYVHFYVSRLTEFLTQQRW